MPAPSVLSLASAALRGRLYIAAPLGPLWDSDAAVGKAQPDVSVPKRTSDGALRVCDLSKPFHA